MQQGDFRRVTICYQEVQVQTEFAEFLTLQQMITGFFKDKQYVQQAQSAFKSKGKLFIPLKQPEKAQVRLNAHEGQFCKKFLRLNQYQKKKRLRFYIHAKAAKQQKRLKQESLKPNSKQVQIIVATMAGQEKEGQKYTLEVDKYNSFNDVFNFLREKMQLPEDTQFKLKNVDEQKLLNVKKDTNFKEFLTRQNIRKLHAIIIFGAG